MKEVDEERWNEAIGHLEWPRRKTVSAPKRRWFSFSLRTLLIGVTLFGLWLGWNVRQVQKRTEAIGYIKAKGGGLWSFPPRPGKRPKNYPKDHLPIVWRWLGAEPVGTIQLYYHLFPPSDLDRIAPLFPEADVAVPPHGGTGVM